MVMAHFSVKNSIRGFVIFQIKQAAVITELQNTPDMNRFCHASVETVEDIKKQPCKELFYFLCYRLSL